VPGIKQISVNHLREIFEGRIFFYDVGVYGRIAIAVS
jgi:hypothetical protein